MKCPECTENLELVNPIAELWHCKHCGIWQIHSQQRLEEIEKLAMENQDLTVRQLSEKFEEQKAKERFYV